MTLKSRSPLLLGHCSCQLHKSCAGANMVYSRAEHVFIFEHYCTLKSFAAIHEAFSNTYLDNKVPNKTIHHLVPKFQDRGSVCLWQVLTEWQNSWNYGCTNLKQCISCNNETQLQEFNIAIGFVVLCMKRFMCSSYGCILNGTPCTTKRKYELMEKFGTVWLNTTDTISLQSLNWVYVTVASENHSYEIKYAWSMQ
jgi:hypothetical protein